MEDEVQSFWVYKQGKLVLVLNSEPGVFIPTSAHDGEGEPRCEFASGKFMSTEWEPRVRFIMRRAEDLVDLIELLEDRRYEIDLEPPSKRGRPFDFL